MVELTYHPTVCLHLFLQLALFEFENFRGKKVELSGECKDAFEKAQRVGSVIVESGPWVIQFPFKSHKFLLHLHPLFIVVFTLFTIIVCFYV